MINLLPHREERRQRKKIAFYAGLGWPLRSSALRSSASGTSWSSS